MDHFGRMTIMKKPVKLSKPGIHGRPVYLGRIDSLQAGSCKRNKFNRDGILRSVIEWWMDRPVLQMVPSWSVWRRCQCWTSWFLSRWFGDRSKNNLLPGYVWGRSMWERTDMRVNMGRGKCWIYLQRRWVQFKTISIHYKIISTAVYRISKLYHYILYYIDCICNKYW